MVKGFPGQQSSFTLSSASSEYLMSNPSTYNEHTRPEQDCTVPHWPYIFWNFIFFSTCTAYFHHTQFLHFHFEYLTTSIKINDLNKVNSYSKTLFKTIIFQKRKNFMYIQNTWIAHKGQVLYNISCFCVVLYELQDLHPECWSCTSWTCSWPPLHQTLRSGSWLWCPSSPHFPEKI